MRSKPTSFLIINTYGIGDVLFSTPLIRNLKESFPNARIFYLCNRRTEGILNTHPLIERTFVYERDEFEAVKQRSWIGSFKMWHAFIRDIRGEKIDVALDLSMNSLFGFIALLAGIRTRVGFSYKRRGIFLTKKVRVDGFLDKHVCEYYLDTLRALGIEAIPRFMEVFPSTTSRSFAEAFLNNNGIEKSDIVIGIAPCGGQAFGKSASVKRWPEERFSELIDRLIERRQVKILLFVGPNEKEEIGRILNSVKKKERCFELADRSLDEMIALVERCDLFISNDTGPLRFANALQKKIIAFFGPVDENVYGLYPFDHTLNVHMTKKMECRPCYRKFRLAECTNDLRCLKDITVDDVEREVERFLP